MKWWQYIREEYKRQLSKDDEDPFDLEVATTKPAWNYYERRDIRRVMQEKNPVRFARLKRDMKWLRRECIKEGLDPEQARFLI